MTPTPKKPRKSKAGPNPGPVAETWRRLGFFHETRALTADDRRRGYYGEKLTALSGRLSAVIDLMAQSKADQFPLSCPKNREYVKRDLGSAKDKEGWNEWRGGSRSDLDRALRGDIDMAPFETAKQKFENSELMQRIRSKIADGAPKRRRVMSEYDGEWQYDRQWDCNPFASSYRPPSTVKAVTIEADFSINCGAGSDKINRYGAMVWALCNLIETYGIQTRIVWTQRSQRLDSGSGKLCGWIELELKKPGEYLPPSFLAATFTSNFYRRMGFALLIAEADLAGKTIASDYGTSVQGPVCEFRDGVLRLGADSVDGWDAEIEKSLLQAIGAK